MNNAPGKLSEAKREKEIPSNLNLTQDSLGRLHDRITRLEELLTPLLAPAPATDETENKEPFPISCKLACEIFNINVKVKEATQKIDALIDTIEL